METYTVHAERLGLKLDSEDLDVEDVGARPEEAAALEVPEGSPLVRVSRVLLIEGNPAAWMVDVVPESVLGAEEIRERFRPDAMLLDLLVSEGVPVGFSQMFIEAAMLGPDDPVGGKLRLKEPSAALVLTQTMYLADGRPVQWSRDTFLPGKLNLHVVRGSSRYGNSPKSRSSRPDVSSMFLALDRRDSCSIDYRQEFQDATGRLAANTACTCSRNEAPRANLPSNMALPTVKPQTPASAKLRILSSLFMLPAAITGTSTARPPIAPARLRRRRSGRRADRGRLRPPWPPAVGRSP